MDDRDYMRMALGLAEKGCGWVSPNPMVGAVVVKDGSVIGAGYHETCGAPHAERNALSACTESAKGATMYVTMEPCCHHGRQPPCVDAILEAGIARVVVGSDDPNPLVNGKGIGSLRNQGVSVTEHVLKEECDRLNQVYFHYTRTKRPYVVMKYAMTMDGKIAAYTGASRWITGAAARSHAHRLRHRCRAIMAGVGTVLSDNPLLTCRVEGGRDPVRIICDTWLRTPLSARVVVTAAETPTIIATCCSDQGKRLPFQEAGCRILAVPERDGKVDLRALTDRLGQEGIDSILLEGGGALNWSAIDSGIVQKVLAYVAPKLIGGQSAKAPVGGRGFSSPAESIILEPGMVTRLGDDILIESEVCGDVHRDC